MYLLMFLTAVRAENAAAQFWDTLAASTQLPLQPPHTPFFTVTLEHVPYNGAVGPYTLATHVVRDQAAGGVVVAVWVEDDSVGQEHNITGLTPGLNLLAPTPAMAPLELPTLERYGWAFLYGARLVTISWLDCCSITGDAYGATFTAAPDGASATLSQWQSWVPTGHVPGRTGSSVHNFTIAWDPVYGYSVDAVTSLRINSASLAGLQAVEFLNFLAPTLLQPWPAGARVGTWGGTHPSGAPLPAELGPWPLPLSTHTAYTNDSAGAAWTGFANNVLAGGEMDRYYMQPTTGATVYAVPGGYSPGLAWAASPAQGAAGMAQETCPAWGDQHHFVLLPAGPGPDGYFTLAPQFALRWAPPPISQRVLAQLTDVHSSPPPPGYPYPPPRWSASNFLRIGALEDFEAQAVPLTQPLRALTYSTGRSGPVGYDYDVVPGQGRGGSAAWRLAAMLPSEAAQPAAFQSPVPLLPLNASQGYALSAWVRLGAGWHPSATALLWVGLYEETLIAGPGPSYGRLAYFNSSVLTGGGVGGGAAAWVSEAVTGGRPVLRSSSSRSRSSGSASANSSAQADGWTLLDIHFVAPPWASFADLRPIVASPAGSADFVLVDDWLFTQE